VTAHPARATEVTVLVLASLLATVIRFVIYRHWVFRQRRPVPVPAAGTSGTVLSFPTKNGQHR